MPKVNREGQASLLTGKDIEKILSFLKNPDKLIFTIAIYTGERWGAILKLKIKDVYDSRLRPQKYITYSALTRKKSAGKTPKTRQVPVHDELYDALRDYDLYSENGDDYLFPAPRDHSKPISFQLVDIHLREALRRSGLSNKGISTHSTRRTWITQMARQKIPIAELKGLTGHTNTDSLMRYIEEDPAIAKKAIENLKF